MSEKTIEELEKEIERKKIEAHKAELLEYVKTIKPKDGKDANEERIIVKTALQVLKRIPKPKDGEPGKAGKDADEDKIIERILSKIPEPKKIDTKELENKILSKIPKVDLEPISEKIEKLNENTLKKVKQIENTTKDINKRLSFQSSNQQTSYGGEISKFTQLSDVPTSYTGQSLKSLRVKADETGLEFFTGSGFIDWGEIGGTITDQTDFTTYLSTNYYPLSTNPAGYLTSASLSGYVPYTGANADVNLGTHNFLTTGTLGAGAGTFTGLVSPYIAPLADSTTAFQIRKANKTTSVLNVDTTNGWIGFGSMTTPLRPFHLSFSANVTPIMVDDYNDSNNNGMIFRSAKGTLELPVTVTTDFLLGASLYRGYSTSAWSARNTALFGAYAAENWTDSAQGSYMVFAVTPKLSTTRAEVMRITSNGVGIGTTDPSAVLHLKAGTATAGTAPFKMTPGVVNTVAEAGTLEYITGAYILQSDKLAINAKSVATGYTLNVGGFINSDQTVNQAAYSSVNASQTASTLQDGSANTGVDTTMSTMYLATQITASASHTMGDYRLRLKESADITNVTGTITGYIYADDGGTPGKPTGGALATGRAVRFGTITSSYVVLSFGTTFTMVSGTKYWLVVRWSVTPIGGNLVFDSATVTNMGATSTDGSTWTNTDVQLYHSIRGLTYIGVYGTSTNSYGVYGTSTNSFGVYGASTNYFGVYGASTNSYGVQGTSTNSIGVYGVSVNYYGVYGISTNSYGVYGISTTNRAGYFYRNNTAGTATTAVMDIVQDSATDETNTVLRIQGDGTGDLVNIFDGATEVFTILDGGNIGIAGTRNLYFNAATEYINSANAGYLDLNANTGIRLNKDTAITGDCKATTYHVGTDAGVDGTFTTADSKTVTVKKGIITSII